MSDKTYQVKRFGDEQEPVVIIDDFSSNPDALVGKLTGAAFNLPPSHYPGVRQAIDATYLAENGARLEDIMRNIFGITKGASVIECNASIVTTPREQLSPFQCFPHFDGVERERLAVLHYLCEPKHGGTAFYRHTSTGYETINAERHSDYSAARQDEYDGSLPPNYFYGDRDGFERIGEVRAKFNRCIIYRSQLLHSGIISNEYDFSPSPTQSRLTLNTFFMGRV